MQVQNSQPQGHRKTRWLWIPVAALTVAFGFGMLKASAEGSAPDLKILKSEVTTKAKFYPYKAGDTYMEVMAVKASDGTVRTALNTCQVCFDSGRGYYTQQGDEMVCGNCGSRFKIDMIEKVKNGCNPVPILSDGKKDDGKTITISGKYLNEHKWYFARWKK